MRLLHFTSGDGDNGEEYVVFVDDDTPSEDYLIDGYKLYAEGEIDSIQPRVLNGIAVGDTYHRRN